MAGHDRPPLCPSASLNMEGTRAFAVVGGTAEHPQLIYLDQTLPADQELVKLAEPVTPTEVFRFAGHCAGGACQHFDGDSHRCQLVERVIQWMPAAEERLPPCPVRRDCVWWNQEGKAACQRCSRVVSSNYAPSETYRRAARPAQGDR